MSGVQAQVLHLELPTTEEKNTVFDKHRQILELAHTALSGKLITLGSCHLGEHQFITFKLTYMVSIDFSLLSKCLIQRCFLRAHRMLVHDHGITHDTVLNYQIYGERVSTRSTQPWDSPVFSICHINHKLRVRDKILMASSTVSPSLLHQPTPLPVCVGSPPR